MADSFKKHVRHLFEQYTSSKALPSSLCGRTMDDAWDPVENILGFVDALPKFVDTIYTHAYPCLPADIDALRWAYAAAQDALQDVIFEAAEDKHKIWTYQGYMDLVLAVHRLLDHCRSFGMHKEFVDNVDGDLRVRNSMP